MGLVKLRHVAIDGTKIKENASKHSAMSYGYMKKEEPEAAGRDREDAERRRTRSTGWKTRSMVTNPVGELPEELSTREKRLKAIRRARPELEREARERHERSRLSAGKKPSPGGRHRPVKDPEDVKPKESDQWDFYGF